MMRRRALVTCVMMAAGLWGWDGVMTSLASARTRALVSTDERHAPEMQGTPTVSISGINPNPPPYGPVDQPIIVNGSGFQSGLTVAVGFPDGGGGTLSGTQIQNVTSTSFTMIITLGGPGTFWIRVRNPNGAQSNQFSFTGTPPAITSISPNPPASGPTDQAIVVRGNGFLAGLTVAVGFPDGGGGSLSGTQIQNVTATSFTMIITLGGPGTFSIRVRNPGGAQSNQFSFTATATSPPPATPTITGISPNPPTAGLTDQAIAVNGSSFQAGLTVAVGFPDGGSGSLSGTQIQNVTPTSFTMIITLGGPGTFRIRIRNPGGAESNQFSFPVNAAPVTFAIAPSSGTQTLTTFVSTGRGYQPNGMVRRFLHQPGSGGYVEIGSIQANAAGEISWNYLPDCTYPIGTTSMYLVDAQTQAQSNPASFILDAAPACQTPPPSQPLRITSATPTQAIRGRDTTFTITGTGFAPTFTAALLIDNGRFDIPAVHFTSETSIAITPFIGGAGATTAQIEITSGGHTASFSFNVVAGGDDMQFVADIGVQDHAVLTPGAAFTKTWRVRNTGETSWGSGYTLEFVGRDRMGAPSSIPLPATTPGTLRDVSVSMVAPSEPGTYQGFWRMRNAAGTSFGPQIWASIVVPASGSVPTMRVLTALTHGFQPFGSMPDSYPMLGVRINAAIAERGRASDAFLHTVVFNWAPQSNNRGFGWATAAGDQLFADLAERLHGQSNVAVHLIGHSLGGTVVDQAALRLVQYGFRVRQVTFLEAVSTKALWSNPGIRAWNGIERIDNYNGNGCFVIVTAPFKDHMPIGRIVPDGSAHEVVKPQYDHSGSCGYSGGIVDFYSGTVVPSPGVDREGWYWSPLAENGAADFPDVPANPPREMDFGPAETVMNGRFTMLDASGTGNLPGYEWSENGNRIDGMDPRTTLVLRHRGGSRDDYAVLLRAIPSGINPTLVPVLRHAPLYIQGDPSRPRYVDTLRFEYLQRYLRAGDHLEVSVGDTVLTDCVPDQSDGDWHFIDCRLPSQVLNTAAPLQFKLARATLVAGAQEIWLDNITLEQSGAARVRSDGALWHLASAGGSSAVTAATAATDKTRTTNASGSVIGAPASAFSVEERDVEIHIENSNYASWNVTADVDWLTVSPATVTGDGGTVHVTMHLTGLEPGAHVATLQVLPTGWTGAPDVGTSVPVVVTIAAPESQPAQDNAEVAFQNGLKVTVHGLAAPGELTMAQASLMTMPAVEGFSLPNRAVAYRVTSTTSFTGQAVLTLPFDASSLEEGARPALVRIDGDTLEEITSGVDLDNGLIYGTSPSLGEFAVVSDTRPRAQFLAEGTTGGFFDELVELANPHDRAADVLVKFLQGAGRQPVLRQLTLPPLSRYTIDIRKDMPDVPGDTSVVVQPLNGLEVVTERTMTWDHERRYGGHSGGGQTMPSVRWYFAEGATGSLFDLWILLANPHTVDADVRVTFLKEDSSTIVRTYVVPAQARLTIGVDAIPGLQTAAVSTLVESTNGIAVYADRSMYWSTRGLLWRGGHSSPGVAQTSSHWFFAEGATGSFFDLFLLLANPGTATVPAQVTYLKMDGTTVVKRYDLAPTSRTTIPVDAIAGLEGGGVSMVVETLNGAGIVAERAMYWGGAGQGWVEGHSSPGVTGTATRWALAGGDVGPDKAATYILIANPSAQPTRVRVTFLRENGRPPVIKEFDVAATSRFNVSVLPGGSADVPELTFERFGAIVESLNGTGIVVEHAVYWNALGIMWEGGTNGTAQPIK